MQDVQHDLDDIVDTRLPVLDLEAFRNLSGLLGPSRVMHLTVTFFTDAERRLSALEEGTATVSDLHEHAHALVSMAGHLGFARLSALCVRMQDGAFQDNWRKAPSAIRTSLTGAREAVASQL